MSHDEPLTEAELESIAIRVAAASPGPWSAWVEGRDGFGGDNLILIGPRDSDNALPDMYVTHADSDGTHPAPAEDLDFIANARQDIPRLIAEIRRLRSQSPLTTQISCSQAGTPPIRWSTAGRLGGTRQPRISDLQGLLGALRAEISRHRRGST